MDGVSCIPSPRFLRLSGKVVGAKSSNRADGLFKMGFCPGAETEATSRSEAPGLPPLRPATDTRTDANRLGPTGRWLSELEKRLRAEDGVPVGERMKRMDEETT